MSLLTDGLPGAVEIGGVRWPIRTDFRVGIEFELTMLDPERSVEEKVARTLELYYPKIPYDLTAAVSAAMAFYCCGREPENKKSEAEPARPPLYDFEYDGALILAAFRQQYGIDLLAARLHWWAFKALLKGLTADTLFMQVVGWRGEEIDPKAPAKSRERLEKLKRIYAIPERRSAAEQQTRDEVMQVLMQGGDVSSLLQRSVADAGHPVPTM